MGVRGECGWEMGRLEMPLRGALSAISSGSGRILTALELL